MRSHFRNRVRARREWGLPDPHSTGSPEFAERHQCQEVEIVGFHPGTVRVDVGSGLAEPSVPSGDMTPTTPIYFPPVPSSPFAEPDLKPGLGRPTRKP